jgi:hypothetical protein
MMPLESIEDVWGAEPWGAWGAVFRPGPAMLFRLGTQAGDGGHSRRRITVGIFSVGVNVSGKSHCETRPMPSPRVRVSRMN